MNKDKILSTFFVFLGLLVVVGSSYLIASYASDLLRAVVEFVTTNDYAKLRQCGVTLPEQFDHARTDLTTVILPFLYAGLPLLFLLSSVFMFAGGFYYHKMRHQEETEKRNQIKRELVGKLSEKTDSKKASPSGIKPAQTVLEKQPEDVHVADEEDV